MKTGTPSLAARSKRAREKTREANHTALHSSTCSLVLITDLTLTADCPDAMQVVLSAQ